MRPARYKRPHQAINASVFVDFIVVAVVLYHFCYGYSHSEKVQIRCSHVAGMANVTTRMKIVCSWIIISKRTRESAATTVPKQTMKMNTKNIMRRTTRTPYSWYMLLLLLPLTLSHLYFQVNHLETNPKMSVDICNCLLVGNMLGNGSVIIDVHLRIVIENALALFFFDLDFILKSMPT